MIAILASAEMASASIQPLYEVYSMQQKSSGCNWTRSELPTLGLRLQKQVCQINANQEAVFLSAIALCCFVYPSIKQRGMQQIISWKVPTSMIQVLTIRQRETGLPDNIELFTGMSAPVMKNDCQLTSLESQASSQENRKRFYRRLSFHSGPEASIGSKTWKWVSISCYIVLNGFYEWVFG